MATVEKVDWFCPKCNSYVSSESVTFEETHQICKTEVILEHLNQNKMKQTAVEWLFSKLSEQGTLYLEDFKQAKEMEEEQVMGLFYSIFRT